MDTDTAASRLALALQPKNLVMAWSQYAQFAREVHAEAGPGVLADIVHAVEQHAVLGRVA